LDNIQKKTPTKQRILDSAIHLFAIKGYTETSMRVLAEYVGVKEASIYNHFPSKNAILDCILDEYIHFTHSNYNRDNMSKLADNPTVDGMLSCMTLSFPEGKEEYFLNELCVILQEQYRNPTVRKFITEHFIIATEKVVENIMNKLKELNVIHPDSDTDFWVKMHSSLIYTFSSRFLLGIGDNSPDFLGKGMRDLLRDLYSLMFKTCAIGNVQSTESEPIT
jgi:AcrR family transcriptional regulator